MATAMLKGISKLNIDRKIDNFIDYQNFNKNIYYLKNFASKMENATIYEKELLQRY